MRRAIDDSLQTDVAPRRCRVGRRHLAVEIVGVPHICSEFVEDPSPWIAVGSLLDPDSFITLLREFDDPARVDEPVGLGLGVIQGREVFDPDGAGAVHEDSSLDRSFGPAAEARRRAVRDQRDRHGPDHRRVLDDRDGVCLHVAGGVDTQIAQWVHEPGTPCASRDATDDRSDHKESDREHHASPPPDRVDVTKLGDHDR